MIWIFDEAKATGPTSYRNIPRLIMIKVHPYHYHIRIHCMINMYHDLPKINAQQDQSTS
jgi:hypothetical protein